MDKPQISHIAIYFRPLLHYIKNTEQNNTLAGSKQPVSNFAGLMSTPMMREAPACLQPMIAASPTAPRPNTAQLEPRSTLAVFNAAPYPVDMPQPSRHTLSSPALLSTYHEILSMQYKKTSVQLTKFIHNVTSIS